MAEEHDPFDLGPRLRKLAEARYGGSLHEAAQALLTDEELEEHFYAVARIPRADRRRYIEAILLAEENGRTQRSG